MILYFVLCLPNFHVSNVALFLPNTIVHYLSLDVVLPPYIQWNATTRAGIRQLTKLHYPVIHTVRSIRSISRPYHNPVLVCYHWLLMMGLLSNRRSQAMSSTHFNRAAIHTTLCHVRLLLQTFPLLLLKFFHVGYPYALLILRIMFFSSTNLFIFHTKNYWVNS